MYIYTLRQPLLLHFLKIDFKLEQFQTILTPVFSFSRPLWPPSSSIDSQESLNLDAAKETASKEIVSKGTTLKEIVTKEAASKETIGTIQVFSINSNISYSMIKLLLLNDEFDESICVSGTDPGVGFDAGESRSNGCANVN